MKKSASHWAASFLLARYERGASGPDAYDCWSLVRAAVLQSRGCELPLIGGAGDDQVRHLVTEAARKGWRKVDGTPLDGDIVLMRSGAGERHVGLMVSDGISLRLLHCERGGPRWQRLAELPQLGYRDRQLWRLAA